MMIAAYAAICLGMSFLGAVTAFRVIRGKWPWRG